ncbi:MAG TPA: glycosyltransferase [Candidatus Methylacidiphilales bacterium]
MTRLLYLYPEEWTARRAREVHTLSTCVALAQHGVEVTLVTAGGKSKLREHLHEIAGAMEVPGLHFVALSRTLGPLRSAVIFSSHFKKWFRTQPRFDWAYVIHLKAAEMLRRMGMRYLYEAHEIFAETPLKNPSRQNRLHELEREVLFGAGARVATSSALAAALRGRYALPNDFSVVPNAGLPPFERNVGTPGGPFAYCGSIADWKGLDLIIHASRDAHVPLKIIGGTTGEWRQLGEKIDTTQIIWQSRVPLNELPQVLTGARAGLIPTQPQTPSGRYSCPMKLFDYARCGLPVLSTALPSLQSLHTGSWCVEVASSTREAWAGALKNFRCDALQADEARLWSGHHTWAHRAELLKRAVGL